jgi:hypothetical protein
MRLCDSVCLCVGGGYQFLHSVHDFCIMLLRYNTAHGLEINRFIQHFLKCCTVVYSYGAGEVCKQFVSCCILCVISVCRTDEIYASGFEIMLKKFSKSLCNLIALLTRAVSSLSRSAHVRRKWRLMIWWLSSPVFPKYFLLADPLFASKNSHGPSHACWCKLSAWMVGIQN